ncbi:unnamed protein product [Cuscuta epithymum]|uniref:Glycine-rich protein n=1 Tax=Cuscuta epithymum TaxID=186058 RepID=A0AAV0CKW7_9ASTE|nr:unnamed protein product [Cuscuta epithymum]
MKTKANLSTKIIMTVILLLITLIADVCVDPVSAEGGGGHGGGGHSGGGHAGGESGGGEHGSGGEGEEGGSGRTRVVPAGHGNSKGNGAQLTKSPFMFGLHLDAVIIFNLLVFYLI